MEQIAELTEADGGKTLQSFRYSLDSQGMPTANYDDTPEGVIWNGLGEDSPSKIPTNLRGLAQSLYENCPEPIIRYFLDGSRHVYHIDDIAYNHKVYPVIAGQVGVACCQRTEGRMKKQSLVSEIVISLPKNCDKDGRHHEEYLANHCATLNNNPLLSKFDYPIEIKKVLTYKTDRTEKIPFKDRATATVQDYMSNAEKKMVDELSKARVFGYKKMLVKDGSLEYAPVSSLKTKYVDITGFLDSFRWVIGVSKSFNPENCKDKSGKKSNANEVIGLKQFERTPVARIKIDRIPDVEFGVWYIRIRSIEQTRTPFDGLLKVEKILVTESEKANGLSTEEVDLISATLINERIPTCYGSDLRFANHLYPVYLTEQFVKSNYISNEMFIKLF
jgi:hypothetical protein